MTWLAPGFLVAGVAAAMAVLALHLIALQRPRRYMLPTARFVPESAARAAALTRRPSDLLLLLLRMLALLALGAAFARPVILPERSPRRQILVVDRSDAVADVGELRDSVLAHRAAGDVVILVDSAARAMAASTLDSLGALTLARERASLAAGLVAARRMATALADSTDSLRLVVISPFAREAMTDDALPMVRDGWPGGLLLVRVAARADSARRTRLELAGATPDADVLAAGVALAAVATPHPVRLVRTDPSAPDSAWARGGGVLVSWPAAMPAGWAERAEPDTVGAVVAGAATMVAPFARRWDAPGGVGRVAARWVDGEPAAVEERLGEGCLRVVGIPLETRGDLTLRPAFGALLGELAAPCGGPRDLRPAPDSLLASLADAGETMVPVAELRHADQRAPFVPWLLGLSLLLLLLEWLLRGRARMGGGVETVAAVGAVAPAAAPAPARDSGGAA